MPEDKFESNYKVNVLDYWYDEEEQKAYCLVEYINLNKKDDKHTNTYLIESKYIGQ